MKANEIKKILEINLEKINFNKNLNLDTEIPIGSYSEFYDATKDVRTNEYFLLIKYKMLFFIVKDGSKIIRSTRIYDSLFKKYVK